ncbi:MAG TPA: glycosyltransferase [Longimicrobium sp.]|nr:glycosyltransferase [Longimicrobium sp.]
MRVLTLADWYLPGSRGGGVPRSIANLAERLGGEAEFAVVTRDRDVGEREPYRNVRAGEWTAVGSARVLYLDGGPSAGVLRRAVGETRAEVLYLNSVFSWAFSIRPLLLWRAGAIPRLPVVLAPRGELNAGAMRIRGAKKRAFLAAVRAAGLHRGVTWQVSTELEAEEVRRWFGRGARVRIARDLPPAPVDADAPRAPKEAGVLRAVFLSRISPKKNLLGTLEILAGVSGPVRLDVFGPVEDAAYWAACERRAASLPTNVTVRYRGALAHEEVGAALREQDLFFLPTLGENYGHVVQEALLAGCPVLLSDTTPWRGLAERGVGWDLPLDDTAGFRAVLEACVRMGAREHAAMSARARRMGMDEARAAEALADNLAVFREAAASRPPAARPGSPAARAV